MDEAIISRVAGQLGMSEVTVRTVLAAYGEAIKVERAQEKARKEEEGKVGRGADKGKG